MWVRGLKLLASIVIILLLVAPRVGAWIETLDNALKVLSVESHPVWVRGLKLSNNGYNCNIHRVAPRVGAWIETRSTEITLRALSVAPRVGAWIETAQ